MAMRRFTEEQIISILKKPDQRANSPDFPREMNVLDATIYKWI